METMSQPLSQSRTRGKQPVNTPVQSTAKPSRASMTEHDREHKDIVFSQLVTRLELMEGTLKELKLDISQITNNIQEVRSDTSELKGDTHQLKVNTTDIKTRAGHDMDKLTELLAVGHRQHEADRRDYLIAEHNIQLLEVSNKKLMTQLNDQENKIRATNIKIDGKIEIEGENLLDYVKQLFQYVNPDGDLTAVLTAQRLGKRNLNIMTENPQRKNKPRPILVTLRSIQDRNVYYYARSKLMKSDQFRNIYLNDDVTATTHKMRDDFRSVAALARDEGFNVKIHGDGIVLNDRKYKYNEINLLPTNVTIAKAKTVKIGEGVFFHSEHSFLSNFYPSPIVNKDVVYRTAEHCYQAAKCTMLGDHDSAAQIRLAATPIEAKRIADLVAETPQWRQNKLAVMEEVIDQKFRQNPELREQLLETGTCTLHEATTNTYFGIGATLHSRELRDRSYKGLNKLGQALQELREKLKRVVAD